MMQQVFDIPISYKKLYGEVTTPYEIIDGILDSLPPDAYNPGQRWLDMGAGHGYFAERALGRLGSGRTKDMHLSEINPERVAHLRSIYPLENVHAGDFLVHDAMYNVIIGNPPYVVSGTKKVPTQAGVTKRDDGLTSWTIFVRKALSLLHEGGYLAIIVPCLWMRRDKAKIHELVAQHQLISVKCYNASEANRLFRGKAQTPVSAMVVRKTSPCDTTRIYCPMANRYVIYPFLSDEVLPVSCPSLVALFQSLRDTYGSVHVYKTNMPGKDVSIGDGDEHQYANIRTVVVQDSVPYLVRENSDRELAWSGIPKLVLAHKMHGLPFVDEHGIYGISSRDNYVIDGRQHPNLKQLCSLFETRTLRCLFDCFRYRMRYLEREVFEFVFDPANIPGLPEHIDDEALANVLGLSQNQWDYIQLSTGRSYERTREN